MRRAFFSSLVFTAVTFFSFGVPTSSVHAASGGGCYTREELIAKIGACINVSGGIQVNPDAYVTFKEKPGSNCRIYISLIDVTNNREHENDYLSLCRDGHIIGNSIIGGIGSEYITQVMILDTVAGWRISVDSPVQSML